MKKVLSIMMIASMIACGATGCSLNQQAERSESGNTGEQVELNYLTWRSRAGVHPDKVIKAFEEKYPNIKVTAQVTDTDQYQQAQQMRMLGGSGIDVTSVTPVNMPTLVESGYLMPLTEEDFLEQYMPETLDSATIDGEVYGVPGAINLIGVIYNQDIFDELKLAIPETFAEFEQACEKIKAAGSTPLVNGEKETWQIEMDTYPFFHDLMLQDSMIFDKANTGEVKYTDKIFVDTFRKIDEFFKKRYIHPDALSLTGSDALQLFVTEQAAMMIHGEWGAQPLDEVQPGFEVGVFPVPVITAEQNKVPVTVANYECIVANTEHPEEAKLFLDFLSSQEGAQMVADGMTAFSAVDGVEMQADTYLKLFNSLLEKESVDFFYSRQNTADNSEMLKLLQELELQQITPEKLAQDLQNFHDNNIA